MFTFEGIGLVIPVRHAMQEPEKFPSVLRRTMVALGVLYVTFGMLSYLAFGDDTRDIITLNLPNNPLVAMVRLLYSTGLLFTFPIMLFPGAPAVARAQSRAAPRETPHRPHSPACQRCKF